MNTIQHNFPLKISTILLIIFLLVGCSISSNSTNSPPLSATITEIIAETLSQSLTESLKNPLLTPMLTQTISSTQTLPAGFTDSLMDGLVVLEWTLGGDIYLQDLTTGENRWIDKEVQIFEGENFLGWARDGCGFLVRSHNLDIVEVDLKGQILRTVFSVQAIDNIDVNADVSKMVLLSPSQNFFATRVRTGERSSIDGYNYHNINEDMIVSSINPKGPPYYISKRGGAWKYQWSPDSNYLVYSDYDENGNFQFYSSYFNGNENYQLTHYPDQRINPDDYQFNWSPNSEYVIAQQLDGSTQNLLVTDREGKNSFTVEDIDQFWWENDSTLGVWRKDSIEWFDPGAGALLRTKTGVPLIGKYVKPIASNKQFVCLWSCIDDESGVNVYNLDDNNLIKMPMAIVDNGEIMGGWIMPPEKFSGESNCEK